MSEIDKSVNKNKSDQIVVFSIDERKCALRWKMARKKPIVNLSLPIYTCPSPETAGTGYELCKQLEKGVSEKYGGTGLRLSITKHLVELHGGKIWAQSKYGEGTTFMLTIPLVDKNKG